jgi:hypothetical protein
MFERLLHFPIQWLVIALGQATSAGTGENFTFNAGSSLEEISKPVQENSTLQHLKRRGLQSSSDALHSPTDPPNSNG